MSASEPNGMQKVSGSASVISSKGMPVLGERSFSLRDLGGLLAARADDQG